MKVTLFQDRILVQKAELRGVDGMILPTLQSSGPKEGIIVEMGPDVKSNVKVGDRVLVEEYGNVEIKHESSTFLLLREEYLIGKIEENNG